MSENNIVTYTEAEQKSLSALQSNEKLFRNIYGLLQSANHSGDKAATLVEVFTSLENIIRQTALQQHSIRQTATQRANTSEETEVTESPKATEKKAKTGTK